MLLYRFFNLSLLFTPCGISTACCGIAYFGSLVLSHGITGNASALLIDRQPLFIGLVQLFQCQLDSVAKAVAFSGKRWRPDQSYRLLRLALHALPAADDVAWAHGLAAFGWEQCHRLHEAETAARRALAMCPADAWAQHALAHVMLTDGRLAEGAYLLHQMSGGWSGLTSFMRCHNWWHLALFHLELGDDAAALKLYDEQVWGVDKTYSQDQVGAVSLLARLELAGVAVGERWTELAGHLAPRTADQVQPFLDLQYLYGLARASRPEADTLLANIGGFAGRAPADARNAWQRVAVPAAHGLLAHARGRWADAADQLALALPGLASIGGSHAQRDLFEQVFIDALQRAGRLAAAQNLLQPQANTVPQSQRLRRRLHEVYAGLQLPALAHH